MVGHGRPLVEAPQLGESPNGQEDSRKAHKKARVRAGRTKVRTQNCDAGNTNISSYYREGEQAGPFCCFLLRAKMPIILFFYDVKQ